MPATKEIQLVRDELAQFGLDLDNDIVGSSTENDFDDDFASEDEADQGFEVDSSVKLKLKLVSLTSTNHSLQRSESI
jgi:hypothetical protein